ncbi:hypothetical protein COCCADRAFT_108905 [Bipolaris zeicola 26-R-13]|uniref:DJ-1/PfpI domain-containing protein n=1 Tax=Cochliobolus carbonum (strain 26-R-13) TaxID=930089 RepID=W6XSA7_COCC2|nr:uncharacterized protein COCCADRAFT_108905 [Bipolaris zeicola 26-R-13]EUC28533.1 hypothetical protein COCCADRAFT_108905 [Bipolaris zeicola 26-R-13]
MTSPTGNSSISFPSQADLFYYCTTSSTSQENLDIHYAPPSRSSLKIGVIILGQVQLLDLAALDLLAMISKSRISKCNPTAAALDQAVDEIDIRYVSMTGEGSFPVTAGSRMPVTNSFINAPQFDILLIPGTSILTNLPPPASSFLTSQCLNTNLLAIMTISSGIAHLVQAGSLHGTRVAAPRSLLPCLQHRFPETEWQYAPWARHGKVWSCNSPVSGLDMVVEWMREYFWDRQEALACVVGVAGVGSLYEYSHCDY